MVVLDNFQYNKKAQLMHNLCYNVIFQKDIKLYSTCSKAEQNKPNIVIIIFNFIINGTS